MTYVGRAPQSHVSGNTLQQDNGKVEITGLLDPLKLLLKEA